jgi:hypothetical protein
MMYFFGTALGAAAIFLLPNIATGIATATWWQFTAGKMYARCFLVFSFGFI